VTTLTVIADRLPRDPHDIHMAVVHATEGLPASPRTLWCRPTQDILVIQASGPAHWTTGRVTTTTVTTEHPQGTSIAFSLIANPTRGGGSGTHSTPDGITHRRRGRTALTDPNDIREWILRRLTPALTDIEVGFDAPQSVWAHKPHHTAIHSRVAFAGTGAVDDPQVLEKLITEGVGPGKAHGLGLMLVKAAVQP
jgi:CRISPR-associated protein Cas6/Cse3/CasE subtype I-E